MAQNDTPGADKATDERALFEEWASNPVRASKLPLARWPLNDGYVDQRTYTAFYGFKAGRASLAAVPVSEPDMRKLLDEHDRGNPKPHHCYQCGLPMIKNPHPDAGTPDALLAVGAVHECLPCMVKSRHSWYRRAMEADKALRDAAAAPAPVSGMPDLAMSEADVMLAGIHAVCVGASQEYTRCKGVMPQWDSGFFAGQMHVFDMYTKADKTAVSEANEYLSKLNDVAPLPAAPAPTEQATPQQQADIDAVYDFMGIGSQARSLPTLMANLRNMNHFADLLHAVEREFFMVPGEPDEDFPDEEPQDECLLNCWGSTEAEYIEQFRAALAALAARQAPDSRDAALNLCEHMWELQPVSSSVRMTEKCRFCHVIREIAVAQEKAQ